VHTCIASQASIAMNRVRNGRPALGVKASLDELGDRTPVNAQAMVARKRPWPKQPASRRARARALGFKILVEQFHEFSTGSRRSQPQFSRML
jgi:hypothetical protein